MIHPGTLFFGSDGVCLVVSFTPMDKHKVRSIVVTGDSIVFVDYFDEEFLGEGVISLSLE
jgi:hypothetical protein